MKRSLLAVSLICLAGGLGLENSLAAGIPGGNEYTNSIGMKFVRIEPGSFDMGAVAGADFDEKPVHKVNITKPFFMAGTEVTNEQFERFDPSHKYFRGRHDLSKAYNEAVIYVTWHDAANFCKWLSQQDGLPYRLPTEAEWEYACRAGTTTKYYTGDELPEVYHKKQEQTWSPQPVDLTVAATPANPWGLYDMHGNVEEWCHDWYGPYLQNEQADPVGRIDGDFKVTRGGSHNTTLKYLTSSNRMGTVPKDKHWLIGFRVVIGQMPKTKPLPVPPAEPWARNVSQRPNDWSRGPDPDKPHFIGPRNFVKIPPNSKGPMFSRHNHQPAITACPNGDIMAIWYSTTGEKGRNLTVVASRLRKGADEWETAAPFWDGPDRNDHGNAIMWDGKRTIYHFNGLGTDGTWGKLALIMRTSTDNGATWSKARLIQPLHALRKQVIAGSFVTKEGYIIVPCDAVTGGSGGSAIHIGRDGGNHWIDYGWNRPKPEFKAGETGAWIAGIHTGCAQLNDGGLLAFGRGNNIDGKMPKSLSTDMGRNWNYSASEFPGIGGGQRLVLERLKEGPLFFGSFSQGDQLVTITDAEGNKRTVKGFFGAVSYDEGKTWPVRRLVTDDKPDHTERSTNAREFTMGPDSGEPGGYFACTQAPDGVIHLISSWNHYAFNLKWLETPPPTAQ